MLIGSLGIDGGESVHTLTNQSQTLSYAQILELWDDTSHPMVMLSLDDILWYETTLQTICSEDITCTDPQAMAVKQMQFFFLKLHYLKDIATKENLGKN